MKNISEAELAVMQVLWQNGDSNIESELII